MHHVAESKLDNTGLIYGHFDGPSWEELDAALMAGAESIRAAAPFVGVGPECRWNTRTRGLVNELLAGAMT